MIEFEETERLQKKYGRWYLNTNDIFQMAKKLATKIVNGKMEVCNEYLDHLDSLILLQIFYRTDKMKEAEIIARKRAVESANKALMSL